MASGRASRGRAIIAAGWMPFLAGAASALVFAFLLFSGGGARPQPWQWATGPRVLRANLEIHTINEPGQGGGAAAPAGAPAGAPGGANRSSQANAAGGQPPQATPAGGPPPEAPAADGQPPQAPAAAAPPPEAPAAAGQPLGRKAGEPGAQQGRQHAPFTVPPAVGLPSDAWRPMVFSGCAPGMPRGYAGCQNLSNLVQAEEIVYPDYRIRMPQAVNAEHRDALSKFIKPRFRKEGDWAYYLNQHGRNFVFQNTAYEGNPMPSWGDRCCMCEGLPATHQQFAPARAMDAGALDDVMFAASPDSSAFQHWRDRTSLMLVQASHLISDKTKFVTSPPSDHTTVDHWRLMVNAGSDRLVSPGTVQARRFVFSCDTPLIHPYLVKRMSERMLAAAGLDPRGKPWDERKVVLLIGRKKDGARNTHERGWLNYDECKPKLEEMLAKRGHGERLEEWDLSRFKGLEDIMRYWNENVRGALGVHGSGLMNVHWAAQRAAILEIWPTLADNSQTRGMNVFWEQAAMMGASYWYFRAVSADTTWNVNVDCGLLAEAVDKMLTPNYETPIEPFYQGIMWSARRS